MEGKGKLSLSERQLRLDINHNTFSTTAKVCDYKEGILNNLLEVGDVWFNYIDFQKYGVYERAYPQTGNGRVSIIVTEDISVCMKYIRSNDVSPHAFGEQTYYVPKLETLSNTILKRYKDFLIKNDCKLNVSCLTNEDIFPERKSSGKFPLVIGIQIKNILTGRTPGYMLIINAPKGVRYTREEFERIFIKCIQEDIIYEFKNIKNKPPYKTVSKEAVYSIMHGFLKEKTEARMISLKESLYNQQDILNRTLNNIRITKHELLKLEMFKEGFKKYEKQGRKEITRVIKTLELNPLLKEYKIDKHFNISFSTNDVHVIHDKKDYNLGSYTVTVNGSMIKIYNDILLKRERETGITNSKNHHPHVDSAGHPCWGPTREVVQFLTEKDIEGVITYTLLFLQSYNPDDSLGRGYQTENGLLLNTIKGIYGTTIGTLKEEGIIKDIKE